MTEIRLAEDQMQRLMRCTLAAGVRAKGMGGDGIPSEIVWECAQDLLIREPKFKTEPKPEPLDDSGTKQPDLLGQISILQMENDGLKEHIEELEKLVPTMRLRVKVHRTPITELYYAVDMVGLAHRMSPMYADEAGCLQWISDHGFEVMT